MYYIAIFGTIFLRLIFHSFEPYPYSYPYPIILTLKTYHSVALKVVQLFPVSNLSPSGFWLKSVSDFARLVIDNIDIASYADDNTPYSVGKSQCDRETKLKKASVKLFKWFYENGLKANQDKCHFLSSLDINTKFSLPACVLENLDSQKLLGVTIHRKLNFNKHVINLCDKTSKKIQALARIFPYIPQTQKRLLMNVYFISQFGYYPLVGMNNGRTLNNRINGLHKRALSLVYNDFSSSFSELLEKDKSVTIHHRNLQTLGYEIFKVKNNTAPEILTEIFPQNKAIIVLEIAQRCRAVMYGSEAISSLGPKLWDILPMELKKIVSPSLFKKKIREWAQKNRLCRLCKTYVQNIGFL